MLKQNGKSAISMLAQDILKSTMKFWMCIHIFSVRFISVILIIIDESHTLNESAVNCPVNLHYSCIFCIIVSYALNRKLNYFKNTIV